MSNVIKFPERKESDLFRYLVEDRRIDISNMDGSIVINAFGDESTLELNGLAEITNREALAQFLWAAAYYLDSEQRYMPDGDLIGISYDD